MFISNQWQQSMWRKENNESLQKRMNADILKIQLAKFVGKFSGILNIMCVCILHSVLQDTKEKIQKMKDYQERLMESLGDVLEKHLPLPQNESSSNKKKKVQ